MLGLEYVRKLKGDTTITLAEKIKVVNSAISQWETGKAKLPPKRAEQIAALYDVPVELLSTELTVFDRIALDERIKGNKDLMRKKLEIENILAQAANFLMNMENLNDFRVTVTASVTVDGKTCNKVRTYKSTPKENNDAESTADKEVL